MGPVVCGLRGLASLIFSLSLAGTRALLGLAEGGVCPEDDFLTGTGWIQDSGLAFLEK